ncbi:uncharacterized protein LOC132201756 [Neocloeon triangulifer]|uniref:uncharacterized protein LOC132201756 n=1 Tax=Neocloeon triangulifer TaxID=2078957 RepID=UPI00286F50BD|nr:uncharacterized protein LOC132201756 [Neocloeon triangulifer]
MMNTKYAIFVLLISTASVLAAVDTDRDLNSDIVSAQTKLGSFINEAIKFRTTYQLILEADVRLEVHNNFEQIYSLMQQLQVDQATIDNIKASANQDVAVFALETSNLDDANLLLINDAYLINVDLRTADLGSANETFYQWNNDIDLFNRRYTIYLVSLQIIGNSIELQVVSAITGLDGPEVTAIYSLLQKTNDRINADAELMQRELVLYNNYITEAILAVYSLLH